MTGLIAACEKNPKFENGVQDFFSAGCWLHSLAHLPVYPLFWVWRGHKSFASMTDHLIMVFWCFSSCISVSLQSNLWYFFKGNYRVGMMWHCTTCDVLFFPFLKKATCTPVFVGMSTKMTLLLVAKAKQELSIMFFPCPSCQSSERMLRPGQLLLYSLLSVGGKSFLLHSYGFLFFSKLDLLLFHPSFC